MSSRALSARTTAEFAAIQRMRMLRAVAHAGAERQGTPLTVADIVTRAGVSRRTFYEHFSDRDECVLAALDDALEKVRSRAASAYGKQEEWCEAVRAALAAILDFLDEDPAAGYLLVVGVLAAGPAAMRRREQALEALVDVVDEGRRVAVDARRLTRINAEGVVGAVLAILHTAFLRSRRAPFASMLGELTGIVVMPYLGTSAASREAAREDSPRAPHGRPPADDRVPPQMFQLRMTARTVKVIKAIAARPGSSNRAVADLSGIVDQGQVSKLLARLAKAGIAENRAKGARSGEANCWWLTREGAQLERMLRSDSSLSG